MTLALQTFVPASIAVTYAAGMLTALSPCVLPLLPIVVGGAMQQHRAAPLLMGIGMTTAFAVAGWMIGALGPAMGLDAEWIHHAAAISLIVFGIALWIDPLANLVSRLVQPLETSADRLAGAVGHQSPAAALFFGGLLGLAWSPCAGPMLVSSLALVAAGRDAALGAVLLGLFGLGAATPLVIAAYASRPGFARLKGWALGHSGFLRHGFGLVAMLSGVFIATGADKLIATQVLAIMPDQWLALVPRY